MKREIKFRAWTTHNGWSDGVMVTETLEDEYIGFLNMGTQKVHYVAEIHKEEGGNIVERNEWVECKDTIVMQFALLKDYKDTDIYVGDILSKKWKVEVYQNDEGTFMVKFNNPKQGNNMSLKAYLKIRTQAGCEERDCVIIGNIYEGIKTEYK